MKTGLIIMSTASKTEKMKKNSDLISAIVELQIVFGDDPVDSSKMDLDTLFRKVEETGKIPQTSQPTPFAIENAINKGLETFDNLVIVTPHSEISGTYQNCINVTSNSERADNIHVFQTNGGIAITEAMLIDYALELARDEVDFKQMIGKLEEFNSRLVIYTFPGDFSYLKVSGRVNGATALILNKLNIRVVIKMEGGKPIIDNKGRGEKSVLKYISNEFDSSKIDSVYYTAIKDNSKMRTEVLKLLSDNGMNPEITEEANSVPAAHLGPNNFGLGVLYKRK